jgi:cytochrome c-type biogenesis protein CcmH/NrfG
VWEQLGVAYQKQGHHRDAVNALKKATKLLPASRLAWQNLSRAYQAAAVLTTHNAPLLRHNN